MNAQFTPGPWEFEVDVEGGNFNLSAGDVCIVGGCGCCSSPYMDGPHQANARLIVAAPDLLAALQSALAVIDDYLAYEHSGDPWEEDARQMGEMDIDDYQRDGRLALARAAIAKATEAA